MISNELEIETIYAAVINGCHQLIKHRNELNKINVFPVADGDTGDNMASVCSAIIDFSEIKEGLSSTFKSIAHAAIMGSRGNSGILLTQFFVGLHKYLPTSNNLSFNNFCSALKKIGEEVNSVLLKPVEGTIITLIQKLSEFLSSQNPLSSIAQAMRAITPLLKAEVDKTADCIKILQESKVVDAGALGFYYFIEGFADFLERGISTKLTTPNKMQSSQEHSHQVSELPQFRYCTEAVLKKPLISQQGLLRKFNKEGNCVGVIGTNDLLKIHLHTNEPIHLFSALYQLGIVKYPKVDDMQRQFEFQFEKKHSIALVTDSSADLPQDLLDKYQIHIIALNIHMGEHDFLDKYSFEPNNFYNQLQRLTSYPTTSCISPYQIKKYLNKLRTYYDHVLILSISSAMSGIHAAFVEASKEDKQITILDTKTNSAAHGLLLKYAGQLIAENFTFAEIIQKTQAAIKNTFIFVLVNQFDSMIRSGRMSKLSAKIASWTHIKPIVSIDKHGRGVVAGKSLSSAKGLDKLIHLVQKQLKKANASLEDYSIVHADNNDDSIHLAKISSDHFNKAPLFICPVSLVIGLHAGKGCVAIAARIAPE